MTIVTSAGQQTVTFAHDALGRMTIDGMTDQAITYNDLDLVGNISKNGTPLVNYSYLANGAKLSAFDGNGEGLMYRGPFVYRKSSDSEGNSSFTLESAAFGGGRLTPARVMLYVTDYLGSVRAVVDGNTGELYKAVDYSTFGEENAVTIAQWGSAAAIPLAAATLPDGTTLRDGYTGKETQNPDFSTGYTDFGARQYSPALRRWMTPDPLSEKYYGISPYAFCNNNPVNLVDPDGRKIRVASEYQRQFSDDLKAIFGDKVESFSFEDEELTLNVSKKDFKKGLSRDQKALFRGLYKALSDDLETIVVYENNYSREVNGEVQNIDIIKNGGGAICTIDKRTIVVAPNIGTVTVTPDDFSLPVEVIQNTTSGLFHEIGERNESNEILRGGVIIYENHARRILGLPERPFDLQHVNPLTIYPIK